MSEDSLILILGGARSGKSAYAERLAAGLGRRVLYVATAEARDEEMAARIAAHRAARPAHWHTLEAPLDAGRAVRAFAGPPPEVILLDCLTLLISNVLLAPDLSGQPPAAVERAALAEVEALLEARQHWQAPLIVVSNEVGLGLVPPSELGRAYRDLLGRANQRLAAAAGRVIFMIAGLPMELKRIDDPPGPI